MSGKIQENAQTVCPELEWVRSAGHLSVFMTVKVTSQQSGRQSVF
jgi:hypothetical protein